MKLVHRSRRLRKNDVIRSMVRENFLRAEDFIYPLFLVEGNGIKEEISSLPDVYHFSIDMLEKEINELVELGIKQVLLFGLPNSKDEVGSGAYAENGIVQQGIREIKKINQSVYVITDICMCQYTDHGHCGILKSTGVVENDETVEYLGKIAISHAEAGADMVAPSDMMDGRVGYMRDVLDEAGYADVSIMAYSAKYASNYYGPFRAAVDSAPSFGDRKSYQMDPANGREALNQVALDIEEGADIVMVKPALSYLDVIKDIKTNFNAPLAAYNVSGEYAMLKNAVKNGLINEEVIMETLLSMKRAGADIIITYFAKEVVKELRGK